MKNLFKTKQDALDFLAGIEWLSDHSEGEKYASNKRYELSYGEYSRPDFYPVEINGGWAIKREFFYYQNTFYAPHDGIIDDEDFADLFLIDYSIYDD